jgi:hypothetical protein
MEPQPGLLAVALRTGAEILARICAEAPKIPIRTANGEPSRPVVLVGEAPDDLGARRDGTVEEALGVVAHDVHRVVARPALAERRVVLSGRAEHDAAAQRPEHLGVLDARGVVLPRVTGVLLETEGLRQELDGRSCVPVAQHRPHGWVWTWS